MDEIQDLARLALGLGVEDQGINAAQMALRAVVVYVAAVLVVRLGKERFMGRSTVFDVILGIMLGSIMSRAITGNAPFFPALAAGGMLVALHWLLLGIASRWHGFGTAIKGHPWLLLVRNGEIDRRVMRQCHISERDLWEDLRGKGIGDLAEVAQGVQTLRIEAGLGEWELG